MRKIGFNYKKWKLKRRLSFGFYFVIMMVILTIITALISSLLGDAINNVLDKSIQIPDLVFIMGISLTVGLILSYLISRLLLIPIEKLQNMMFEVSKGNFDIHIEEKSIFDEIEDMNHYFNLMMNELRATEIIQSDFISNVSHEFKTPLNTIDGYALLLKDETLTKEEKEEYIDKIHYTVGRMNELIGNILLLSKLDNQSIEAKKSDYSLSEQIRQTIVGLAPKWDDKQIDFDIDIDEINYFGTESIMMHVWNNLIDNAIKFSPEKGIIKISLKEKNDQIIFIIEDEGPGIPDDAKSYIFNKFYQVDTSHKADGNGLGLALTKKILDLCDGTIEITNLEPKGCQFKVILR